MIALYIFGGLIVGILFTYLLLNGKLATNKTEIDTFKSQIISIQAEYSKKEITISELNSKLNQAEKMWQEKERILSEKINNHENRLISKDDLISKIIEEKNILEKDSITQITDLKAQNENLKIRFEDLGKLLKDQEEKFARIEENFKHEFKNMAQEILEEKSKKFAEIGKKDLNELIEPLKIRLQDFSKQVRESYENENKERYNLKEEIRKLNDMNIKLSDQAHNLTTALKGESKTQGDWGEMILENMLSDSGLALGREYFKQESVRNEEGKQLRPDIVVKYPDNRFIIIDSKVSLRAYESYISAEEMNEKKIYLQAHLKAVWERVMELSSKNYQDQFEGSPDFVMMFMPIEPAFMVAVQNDSSLWNRAYEKRVILMSPTNLIAALKMINELWKHDAQNKNTIAISEAAGNLYDKFVSFYEDLDDISKGLDKVTLLFNNAKGKLSTGKGNLVNRVQNLKKLGIKTKKEIDSGKIIALDFDPINTDDNEE